MFCFCLCIVSRSFAIDEDDDDGQEEVLSKSRRRMVKKSKDFLEFQPKREEGLYKKLIGDGPDICDEVMFDFRAIFFVWLSS